MYDLDLLWARGETRFACEKCGKRGQRLAQVINRLSRASMTGRRCFDCAHGELSTEASNMEATTRAVAEAMRVPWDGGAAVVQSLLAQMYLSAQEYAEKPEMAPMRTRHGLTRQALHRTIGPQAAVMLVAFRMARFDGAKRYSDLWHGLWRLLDDAALRAQVTQALEAMKG